MNSQTKKSKLRDDKLGGGDHSFEAEKYEGRIVNVIGLEERDTCSVVRVLGFAWLPSPLSSRLSVRKPSEVRSCEIQFLVERIGYCVNDED